MDVDIRSFFADSEIEKIKIILGIEDIDVICARLISASFEEYKQMILGKKVFTRGSDIREYRLFLLIKYFFNGRTPTEQQVSDIFQTTTSESRTLLRSVYAKYQYELRSSLNETIMSYLTGENIELDPNNTEDKKKAYILNLASTLAEEMNRILSKQQGDTALLFKKPKSANTYGINKTSYEKLCTFFEISEDDRLDWSNNG